MVKAETKKSENEVSSRWITVANVLVFFAVVGLSRAYPLPAGILAAIYFSILLGITISKFNVVKERNGDTSKLKREIGGYVAWVVFIAAVLAFQVWSLGGFQLQSNSSSSQTPTELASQAAQEAKASSTLPSELDEVTRFTDITSAGNNIQYHYVLHDADTSTLTSEALRDSIQPKVCANTSTKSLLERGVNLQYLYTVQENSEEYSFTVSNSDC